ncbi:MAG: glycosyltransferase family 4 protein [Bacteroides sp.]|nr:glycosyltransferase family 4 protein [Bacteroides sp.]
MVFLVIGRVLYDKGYSEYIKASEKLKNLADFHWLGPIDESYPNHVSLPQIKYDEVNSSFKYLGESLDVRPYIRNADCIVLPSYHEGMSRTLMEALAMSKPIITSDIPGCREMVEPGKNGFLCQPANAESLIQSITQFINLSPEQRNEFGKYSRKKAEQEFDIRHVIKIYDDIIQNLVQMK